MVVLLPYNQITAASFSMPFYHTSIKRDPCLFTLPLIYIKGFRINCGCLFLVCDFVFFPKGILTQVPKLSPDTRGVRGL